jgi:hypothetical protein
MEHEVKTSHSSEIKEFVAALAKAQGMMKPAVFNKSNPHFKSRYADFSSCMDACRLPLSENGLAVVQYCATLEGKLYLVTMIAHVSGQWMKSEFPLISAKQDSQGIGSAMTYAKRYSLCGMIGIVADEDVQGDDDGETAVGRGAYQEPARQPPRPNIPPKVEAPATQKISGAQVAIIKRLEEKLDADYKGKIYDWMKKSQNVLNLEDILVQNFSVVMTMFENASKMLEQNKKELIHA